MFYAKCNLKTYAAINMAAVPTSCNLALTTLI